MLRLRDIMTKDVLVLQPEATLRDAVETFVSHHVSGAPVVSGGRVVGVVSTTDIIEFEAAAGAVPAERGEEPEWDEWDGSPEENDAVENEAPASEFFNDALEDAGADVVSRFNPTASFEWDTLSEHSVSEAMTQVLFSLPPSASVTEAARYMREAEIHRVLVMEGDALVGIVTTTDIADAVADERIVARQYVFGRSRAGGAHLEGGF